MPLHYVHRFGFLTHFVLKARYVKRRATNEAPYELTPFVTLRAAY